MPTETQNIMKKKIKNYENYTISDSGEVVNEITGKILKPHLTQKGYHSVILYKNGKSQFFRIHRLVAQAFIENPDNKPQVDHINGIKTDNRVSNLRWVTNIENIHNPNTFPNSRNSYKHRKDNCGRLAIVGISQNGRVTHYYKSIRDAKVDGFDPGTICKVLKRQRNQHKGFLWSYA